MELIEGVNARICTKCGTLKRFEKFNKQKTGKYGVTSKCKECQNKYKRTYYQNNKEYKKKYYENNKDKIKEYYQNNKNEIKKYYQNNKEHIKEKVKEYQKNNKDKIKENKKIRNHKRRTLKQNSGGSYTVEQWNESLKYFNNKCAYSGKPMEQVSVEHIIPITKGGTSYIWNIVPCEAILNYSKQDKDLLEWYKEQEFYSEERLNKIYEYIEYMKNKYELKEVI